MNNMAPRKKKGKTKTYKKKMAGPVHKQVKKHYGKKAFYPSGNIKTSYLQENKKRAQKNFTKRKTASNRRALRQATEALNFRSGHPVRA